MQTVPQGLVIGFVEEGVVLLRIFQPNLKILKFLFNVPEKLYFILYQDFLLHRISLNLILQVGVIDILSSLLHAFLESGSGCPSADDFHHLLGGFNQFIFILHFLGLNVPLLQHGYGSKELFHIIIKVGDGRDFTLGHI